MRNPYLTLEQMANERARCKAGSEEQERIESLTFRYIVSLPGDLRITAINYYSHKYEEAINKKSRTTYIWGL